MNKIIITLLCSICFGVSLSSCSHGVTSRLAFETEGLSTYEKLDGHYKLVDSDDKVTFYYTICEDQKVIKVNAVSSESDREQQFTYHIVDVIIPHNYPRSTLYYVIRNDGYEYTIRVSDERVIVESRGFRLERAWVMNIKEREIY